MPRSPLRATPSMAVALLALVLSLSGGAYAATQLAKNSVGTKQLRSNAVTGAKVKDGSLGLADLAAADQAGLVGPRGVPGPAGSPGPTGPPGPSVTGPTGAPGFARVSRGRVTGTFSSGGYGSTTLLRDIGNIAALQVVGSAATLHVTFVGTVSASAGACIYQLRVDSADTAGYTGTTYSATTAGVGAYVPNVNAPQPLVLDAVFTGVGEGTKGVDLYASSQDAGGATCDLGVTIVPGSVVVEQYAAGVQVAGTG